jgi:hypothetical protein
MGEMRNAYKILVGKPEGKKPLGRPKRRWMDNIKIGLRIDLQRSRCKGWFLWPVLYTYIHRYDGMVWTGSIWLRIGTSGGPL